MNLKRNLISAAILGGVCFAGQAAADAVIYNTGDAATASVALGVFDGGHLNVTDPTGFLSTSNAGAVGLAFKFPDGTWRDATAPGCLCEGWGFSATDGGGAAHTAGLSVANSSPGNLTVGASATDAAAGTGSFFVSSASMTSLPGLSISQSYSAADKAPGTLFKNVVSITNTTGSTISDLRYTRVMDWDVPPTEFSEYVTIQGTATTTFLERSHDNGFENVDPLAATTPIDPATDTVDFIDNGPADHGAYFLFNFGDLLDGETFVFTIFYGAAQSELDALAAISAEGIELFSLGQQSGDPNDGTPATFIFGFAGVGGVPVIPPVTGVPLPGTLLLAGLGLVGLGAASRRRQA